MFKNTGGSTPFPLKDNCLDPQEGIDLHHFVTDLTVDEFVDIIHVHLADELRTTGVVEGEDGYVQSLNCVSGQSVLKITPQELWGNDSPCDVFSLYLQLTSSLKHVDLLSVNDINKNTPGLKVYLDDNCLHSSAVLCTKFGVTGQTVVNEIAFLVRSGQHLLLALHKKSGESVN